MCVQGCYSESLQSLVLHQQGYEAHGRLLFLGFGAQLGLFLCFLDMVCSGFWKFFETPRVKISISYPLLT